MKKKCLSYCVMDVSFLVCCARMTNLVRMTLCLVLIMSSFLHLALAANLVLEDTVERIYHGNEYAETRQGVFLIRGENVVLLGEIVRPVSITAYIHSSILHQDLDAEDEVPLQPGPRQQIEKQHQAEVAARKRRENTKATILYEQFGFCREGGEGDGY